MQFGKLHAIALVVFGLVLLVAQALISLVPHQPVPVPASAVSTSDSQSTDRESVIRMLPGILGVLCVAGGVVFYAKESGHNTEVPVHPIR